METIDKVKSAIGLKVVGKINLDEIPDSVRPVKATKEEREAQRQENADRMQEHNREIIVGDLNKKRDDLKAQIKSAQEKLFAARQRMEGKKEELVQLSKERSQKQLRLNYLTQKRVVRDKYLASPITNEQRQRELTFQGIRPQKMDVVHFHVAKTQKTEEMDGVALVRDENHYYLAVDMYDRPDNEYNVTTIMDENPDGTFEGIWPKHACLKEASKFEERYMRALADKYADDLDAAEKYIQLVDINEKEEIETLEKDIAELDGQIAVFQQNNTELNAVSTELVGLTRQLDDVEDDLHKYGQSTVQQEGLNFDIEAPEVMPMEGLEPGTDTERLYTHLPYLRGKRQMMTMDWPAIDTDYEPWLRFRLMGNVARLMKQAQYSHALTYVLTEEYCEELSERGKKYYMGMKPQDVVGDTASGVLVYPNQGHTDTIIYYIDCRNQLSILLVYLREDRLMFYESYSMQEIVGQPRTDSYLCKSLRESGTDRNRLFSWLRNFLVWFLAMECDMERTVNHLIEDGCGSVQETEIGVDDEVDTTDDKDVVIRDANWYTDITVNREIPVRGYISHRLCGTGKDKLVKEVWVRPYVKQGYHRAAGVKIKN